MPIYIDYSLEIKFAYALLFCFSVLCLVMSIKLGYKSDEAGEQLHPVLYILYVIIFMLSIIQAYQCLLLLLGPTTKMWWVPLVCKHLSLWVYFFILKFLNWRHFLDARPEAKKVTTIFAHPPCKFK